MKLALVPITGAADRVATAEAAGRMATGEAADSAEEDAGGIRLLGCLKTPLSSEVSYIQRILESATQ